MSEERRHDTSEQGNSTLRISGRDGPLLAIAMNFSFDLAIPAAESPSECGSVMGRC